MKPIHTRLAFLAVGLLLAAPAAAPGQGAKKSDAYVKVAVKADKPDDSGNQLVTLTLTVEKGWHAYANPVGLEDLADAATKVTAAQGELVKVEYPPGKLHKDAVVGDYKVYEGTVAIKAHLRRAGTAPQPELAVRVQVCNDKTCLPPATVKVKVP